MNQIWFLNYLANLKSKAHTSCLILVEVRCQGLYTPSQCLLYAWYFMAFVTCLYVKSA